MIKTLIQLYHRFRELILYGIIGGSCATLDFIIYTLLSMVIPYLAANVISVHCGIFCSFFLNRPYQGLYVRPGMWRDLEDFSSGAVCMVLASEVYQKEDYIRDYQQFLEFRNNE